MKHTSAPQSATSLPTSPRQEADHRARQYMVTMGIRIACIILMVVVVPYSWYTWIFAAGAVFLPYIAVVVANVGHDSKAVVATSPDRQLTTLPARTAPAAADAAPGVLRISESRPAPDARDEDSAA